LAEVIWHLRGEAGKRQIPNAKAGMAQASGAGGNCTVVILKK
jgi:hypothetical protein